MFTGAQFKGRAALKLDIADNKQPNVDLSEASKVSPEIQFLGQAFERENLTYLFYPYYWPRDSLLADLANLNSNNQDFTRFHRAGSARVVMSAHPGFDEMRKLCTEIEALLILGLVCLPFKENYNSIVEQIKAQHLVPIDGEQCESWKVRLPTTLWFENSAGCPRPPTDQRLDEPPCRRESA